MVVWFYRLFLIEFRKGRDMSNMGWVYGELFCKLFIMFGKKLAFIWGKRILGLRNKKEEGFEIKICLLFFKSNKKNGMVKEDMVGGVGGD